jgi:hypothetical protein
MGCRHGRISSGEGPMSNRTRPYDPFSPHGFGAVSPETIDPTADPVYAAGMAASARAHALPNFLQLFDGTSSFFNILANLDNELQSWRETGHAYDANVTATRTTQLNTLINSLTAEEPPGNPIDTVPVSQQFPAIAVIVRKLYDRYLHRTGSQVDQDGLDYWCQVIINDGAAGNANAERGFRVQAVNDGIYTEATLPSPLYFTPPVVTDDDDDDDPIVDAGVLDDGTPVISAGGFVDSFTTKISEVFDQIAEATSIDKKYLEIGAVALGVGALLYFGSDSKPATRKR